MFGEARPRGSSPRSAAFRSFLAASALAVEDRHLSLVVALAPPRESIQAIATCATLASLASATLRSASTSSRLRSRFSALNRGAWLRKSAGPVCRSFDQCPLSSPLDRTL